MDNQQPPHSSEGPTFDAQEDVKTPTSPLKSEIPAPVRTVGGLVILGAVCVYILSGLFDGTKTSDPEAKKAPSARQAVANTPDAIKGLVREIMPSGTNFDYIKVEPSEAPDDPNYFRIAIGYHAQKISSDEKAFATIRHTMDEVYRRILSHRELRIAFILVTAQLEMADKYGNVVGWNDVYQTGLAPDVVPKINRKNLDLVEFKNVWRVLYTHPIFEPYAGS